MFCLLFFLRLPFPCASIHSIRRIRWELLHVFAIVVVHPFFVFRSQFLILDRILIKFRGIIFFFRLSRIETKRYKDKVKEIAICDPGEDKTKLNAIERRHSTDNKTWRRTRWNPGKKQVISFARFFNFQTLQMKNWSWTTQ